MPQQRGAGREVSRDLCHFGRRVCEAILMSREGHCSCCCRGRRCLLNLHAIPSYQMHSIGTDKDVGRMRDTIGEGDGGIVRVRVEGSLLSVARAVRPVNDGIRGSRSEFSMLE